MNRLKLTDAERDAVGSFIGRAKAALGASFRKAVLFGSRARGEGDEGSDIDILVLVDAVTIERKHAVWDIACDVLLETAIDISPLVMDEGRFDGLRRRERLLAQEIDREGIPL